MKKTILALFLLLFILIVTCAYEKSHTIYAKSAKEHTAPVHNTETASVAVVEKSVKPVTPTVKEKIIVAKTIEKKIEVKTAVQSEHTPSAQTEKSIPKPLVTESTATEKEEEKTLLAKLKSAVLKRLHSDDTETKEEESKQSTSVNTSENQEAQKKSTAPSFVKVPSQEITHNTSEEEIIDHLVLALKNQDLALKNRDKLELEIEALIKRALDDRCTAIAHRKKEALALEKTQKALLEERDQLSKKIPQPYTITPGE